MNIPVAVRPPQLSASSIGLVRSVERAVARPLIHGHRNPAAVRADTTEVILPIDLAGNDATIARAAERHPGCEE